MRPTLSHTIQLLLFASLWHCRFQAGASLGHQYRNQHDVSWNGHLAGSLATGRHNGLIVGGGLDYRGTGQSGSRLSFGLHAGYSWNLRLQRTAIPGIEIQADLGMPVRSGVPFLNYSFYTGLTASLVWWLGPSHEGMSLNQSYWYFVPVPQIVLYLQSRIHIDDPAIESTRTIFVDTTLGVALRMRFVSDLF